MYDLDYDLLAEKGYDWTVQNKDQILNNNDTIKCEKRYFDTDISSITTDVSFIQLINDFLNSKIE